MIRVDDVHKAFGRTVALAGVSFAVDPGALVGLVGPNGAGKTTLLRIVSGYLSADRGRVFVDDVAVDTDPAETGRRLAYLPEAVPLYGEMRVDDYLRFRARIKGVARRAVGEAVDRAVEAVSVADRRRSVIQTLSRGYRQRVGIADAIVGSPSALVLDEPLTGLDPVQVRDFRELVRGLAGEHTVVLSSHDLSEVEALCDRVIVIARGRVVADGPPDELRGDRSLEDVFVDLVAGGDAA